MNRNVPLKELAYKKIKDSIIKCELKPGQLINEIDLSKKLGMSRTPIREAILKLNSDEFITIYPRKGMIVSEITLKKTREIFQIRELIEPVVASKYYKRMSKDYLMDIKNRFKDINFKLTGKEAIKYYDLDIEFHKYIIASSKNDLLIEFMDKVYDHDYRIRVKSTLKIEDIEDRSKPEHFRVIDALLEENDLEIYSSLKEHITNAKEAAILNV